MTPKASRFFLALVFFAAQCRASFAQGGDDAFPFLEEEAKVVIATQHEQAPERAPSIVSVVTRHDIEAYGARDLADILRLVPGFEFGVDVFGITGQSFRGIWAHEGKSLLMIDGIMQNELGYGNYNFFGTIPASMIEKVEIVRGPGSAVYGGFAEVDVINVITHQAKNLDGIRLSGELGAMSRGGSSREGSVSYGSQTDALRVSAHVGYGSTLLSRRDYSDFFGNRLKLDRDTAYRQWQHVVTEASAKNLTIRYQRNSMTWGGQDTFTTIQAPVKGINAERLNDYVDVARVDYKAKVSDRLTLQPIFEYTRNNTYSTPPNSIIGNFNGSNSTLWRYRTEMSAVYEAPWSAQIRAGGGVILDGVESVASDGTPGLQLSSNPADRASRAQASSAFGLFQYLQQAGPVGVTAGGRYEATTFGNAVAPRAGLTYVREAFNAKLLYGRAFRIPTPWQAYDRQFGFNGGLKPETADTIEMELGYKFADHLSGRLNAFYIGIHDPIVYQGNTNTYVNFGKVESQGAEAELRADYLHYGGFANLSVVVPGRGTSPGFVTRSKKQFLSTPPAKVDLGAYYRIGRWEIAPSATYLARRAGQSGASAVDPNGLLETREYPALVLANLNLIARGVLKDIDVHLGVHNVFDTRYLLIQPYYGAHAPMPAQDREIRLGVTWHL